MTSMPARRTALPARENWRASVNDAQRWRTRPKGAAGARSVMVATIAGSADEGLAATSALPLASEGSAVGEKLSRATPSGSIDARRSNASTVHGLWSDRPIGLWTALACEGRKG